VDHVAARMCWYLLVSGTYGSSCLGSRTPLVIQTRTYWSLRPSTSRGSGRIYGA
jgi:hypothetical protein